MTYYSCGNPGAVARICIPVQAYCSGRCGCKGRERVRHHPSSKLHDRTMVSENRIAEGSNVTVDLLKPVVRYVTHPLYVTA